MILRPQASDFQVIGYYVGRIIIGVGFLMVGPLLVAFLYGEIEVALAFVWGFCLAVSLGCVLSLIGPGQREPDWLHGMVIVSLSWIGGVLVGAVPNFLSGHYGSYLDACFDLMSGFTTTGLVLIQDMDHLSNGLNLWRHLVTYAGGQGIVVIALTFLIPGTSSALRMYVGEGREERLRPNIMATARAIWVISLVYLVIGSLVLLVFLLLAGVHFRQAWLQALWLFMTAWSTGGFAPYSQNMLYWHSGPLEMIVIAICVLGSFNFALHFALWTGKRREILRNIEILSFLVTFGIAFWVVSSALLQQGLYPDTLVLFRKAFFQVASAHTGTGLMTVYAPQLLRQWWPLAGAALILAMLIGAGAGSTAGGFKGLRVGILFKAVVEDVKRLTVPEGVYIRDHIHHIRDIPLTDRLVRNAALVVLSYLLLFALGTAVGVFCGYDLPGAMFESASATGNVGLTCGITAPSMPTLLKVTYIFQMWVARLEFVSVYVLVGFLWGALFGIRGRSGRGAPRRQKEGYDVAADSVV